MFDDGQDDGVGVLTVRKDMDIAQTWTISENKEEEVEDDNDDDLPGHGIGPEHFSNEDDDEEQVCISPLSLSSP